jgi:hypothetical protein
MCVSSPHRELTSAALTAVMPHCPRLKNRLRLGPSSLGAAAVIIRQLIIRPPLRETRNWTDWQPGASGTPRNLHSKCEPLECWGEDANFLHAVSRLQRSSAIILIEETPHLSASAQWKLKSHGACKDGSYFVKLKPFWSRLAAIQYHTCYNGIQNLVAVMHSTNCFVNITHFDDY